MASGEKMTPDDLEAITERNLRASPLLRLPGELRNKIYAYVLEPSVRFRKFSLVELRRLERDPKVQPPCWISLLRVCGQIHCEFAVLPFKLLPFVFESLGTFERIVDHLTPAQRQVVRSVVIKTAVDEWNTGNPSGRRVAFKNMLPSAVVVKIVDTRSARNRRTSPNPSSPNMCALRAWFQADSGNKIRVGYAPELSIAFHCRARIALTDRVWSMRARK